MIQKVQIFTGVAISAFSTVHVFNALGALAGPLAYDEMQAILRQAYQHRVGEVALIAAIAAHAVTSAVKIYRRPHSFVKMLQNSKLAFSTKVHRVSGLFLLCVIGMHITATRVIPDLLVGDLPAEKSALIASSLYGNRRLLMLPYYTMLFYFGSFHTLSGLRKSWAYFRGHSMIESAALSQQDRWLSRIGHAALLGSALAVSLALSSSSFATVAQMRVFEPADRLLSAVFGEI